MKSFEPGAELWDIVVIGAGMGGSAFVSKFVGSGLKILLIERGDFLPTEEANWDPEEVLRNRRYESKAMWKLGEQGWFHPRVYYNVGGNSKFFGGTSFRFRESDFHSRQLPDGSETPEWPISYKDLEPWYDEAEKAMKVHGKAGQDPTEAPRNPYPYQPTTHEKDILELSERLRNLGLRPFSLPVAVDQGNGGRCRKGSPCDGFPCRIRAKGDGENAFLRPTLKQDDNIRLVTGLKILRLEHNANGNRVTEALGVDSEGQKSRIRGNVFVLAAGAADSAAILLGSGSAFHPDGLGNGSGQVGRNFMTHNNSVLMALSLFGRNRTKFQKTLAINDFYLPGNPQRPRASGNIQMRGKIVPENLENYPSFIVRFLRRHIARKSFDFWVMSEDPPTDRNRVEIQQDLTIQLHREPGNLDTHEELVRHFRRLLRKAGYPIVFRRKPRIEAVQHQCGTLRAGTDPAVSVVNADGRSHQLENLYVCDASYFPSSGAINPALTVAANALRIGDAVRRTFRNPQ